MALLKFDENEEPFDLKVDLGEYGPLEKPKGLADHKWTISCDLGGGDASISLVCVDPCKMPYDPHSGKLCCCQWVNESEMDISMQDVPVTVTHEDHTGWNYWGDDYEPGWLKVEPIHES